MKNLLLFISALFMNVVFVQAQTQKGAVMLGGAIGTNLDNSKNKTNTQGLGNAISQQVPENKNSNWNVNINPEVHYFLTDKISLGLYLGYGNGMGKTESYNGNRINNGQWEKQTDNTRSYVYQGGASLNYYISVSEKAYFIIGANAGYNKNENKSTIMSNRDLDLAASNFQSMGSEYKNSVSSFNAAISPAFMFFPADKWAIKFTLGSFVRLNTGISRTSSEYVNTNYAGSYLPSSDHKSTFTNLSILSFSSLSPSIGLYYFFK